MRKKTFGKAGWHIAALCWLFFSVGRTEALPEYLAAAKLTYAIKPGSNIATRNCQLCHKQATNANSLNPYGKSVQSALNSASAEQLTPALLHSLDNQDPDNDGFSNASEFQADTLPGDPQSHPDGATSGVVLSNVPKPTNQAEINPFAPRRVLFAKHAQHPVLVHFPIALFLFSLFLDVLGRWRNRAGLHNVALVNLVGAAVMGGASLLTGLLAWQLLFGGMTATFSENRWLYYHLGLGVCTVILLALLCVIRIRRVRKGIPGLSAAYWVLALLTLLVITLAGHLGGVIAGVA